MKIEGNYFQFEVDLGEGIIYHYTISASEKKKYLHQDETLTVIGGRIYEKYFLRCGELER